MVLKDEFVHGQGSRFNKEWPFATIEKELKRQAGKEQWKTRLMKSHHKSKL
jgi:hypothetical protein